MTPWFARDYPKVSLLKAIIDILCWIGIPILVAILWILFAMFGGSFAI